MPIQARDHHVNHLWRITCGESPVANHLKKGRVVAQDGPGDKTRVSAARLPQRQQALPGLRSYKRIGHVTIRADQ